MFWSWGADGAHIDKTTLWEKWGTSCALISESRVLRQISADDVGSFLEGVEGEQVPLGLFYDFASSHRHEENGMRASPLRTDSSNLTSNAYNANERILEAAIRYEKQMLRAHTCTSSGGSGSHILSILPQ